MIFLLFTLKLLCKILNGGLYFIVCEGRNPVGVFDVDFWVEIFLLIEVLLQYPIFCSDIFGESIDGFVEIISRMFGFDTEL